jgi:hypothetical protein
MKVKVSEKLMCERCGKTMHIENTSTARYTVFVLWRCDCGHQFLEKRHTPGTPEL